MNKNNSLDKLGTKNQFVKLERPKSSHLQQHKPKQNSSDGFYFHNNKLVSKKKPVDQMTKTQAFPSHHSSQQDMFEDQNFRVTVKNNNFMESQNQNDNYQNSPQGSIKSEAFDRSRRKTSPEFLNQSQRRSSQQQELRKEIKDLQLIGILDWSDSDKSEDEFEQNKNNRLEFIKQLQGVNAEDSLHESKMIDTPKQSPKYPNQSPKNTTVGQTPRNQEQPSSPKQQAPIIPILPSNKSIKSEKNLSPLSSPTDSKKSQKQLHSNKNLDKSVTSKQSKAALISKKSSIFQTDNNFSSGTLLAPQYGEDEEKAAQRIQKEWKAQKASKEQRKKLAIQNKKKLIAQRQKKQESAIVVIQNFYRRYQSRKNRDFLKDLKDAKQQKDWTICYKQITKVKEEQENMSSHDRWEYYQNPENQNFKLVKLTISYDGRKQSMKIAALPQDNQKDRSELKYYILNLNELQFNSKNLQLLNLQKSKFISHNDMKAIASQLAPHVFISIIQLNIESFILNEQKTLLINLNFILYSNREESLETQEDEEDYVKGSKPSKHSTTEQDEAAQKLQAFYRKKQNKEKVKQFKESNIKKLKKWIIRVYTTNTFFEIGFMNNTKLKTYFMKAKDLNLKQKYPVLRVDAKQVEFWMDQHSDDIYNYFEIDQEDVTIAFSSTYYQRVGIKDLRRAQTFEDLKNIPNMSNINMKALIKVQARIRGRLIRKMYEIQLEKLNKDKEEINEEEFIEFICKNGYVYQSIESYLFKMYYKPKSKEELFENPQQAAKGNFANLIIKCVNLDKKSMFGKVESIKQIAPYLINICFKQYQKLSPKITYLEVKRFGWKILKHSYLKLVRNQLKIVSPNIEQVMQESQNQIKKREGQVVNEMDPELEQKLIFNKKTLVQKRSQYKSLVNFCQFDANQSKNIQPSQIGDLCQRTIYFKYHNFHDQRKVDILQTKNIQEISQLQKKAQLDFPSTDFSKKILSFMESSRFNMDESAPTRPKIDATIVDLNIQCNIQQTLFTIDVYYDPNERQIIVVSQSNEKQQAIGQLIINIGQLAFAQDWSIDSLKANINDLLIQQLRHKNYILYFEENKALKRKNEATQQQKDQPVIAVTNQVQENKNQEKKASLQVFLFTVLYQTMNLDVHIHPSEYKLIVNITQKNITNVKATIEIILAWFSCRSLKSIIDDKDPQQLQNLFFPLFQQMLNILNLTYDPYQQIYTYDLNIVKLNMPKILQNHFATKLQQKFLTVIQKNRYRFMKIISDQTEIHLNTDITVSTNVYFEKRWYLIRDQFQLRVIIERYPKGANRILKKAFHIDLLELKRLFMDISNQKNTRSYIDPEYAVLIDNKWTDIQGTFSKDYYVKTFLDLITYLNKQIQITVLYSKIFVSMNDSKIDLKEEKVISQQQKDKLNKQKRGAYDKIRHIISAVCCVQRSYRKFKKQEWQQLKVQRKKEKEAFVKSLGNRVKRAFKDIEGRMYIVNIYQRENLYTFDLILYNDRREKKNRNIAETVSQVKEQVEKDPLQINIKQIQESSKKKQKKYLRGLYEYDPNQLLNTGAQTIPDFLLERLTIEDDDVVFQENIYKEYQPGAYQNIKIHEEPNILGSNVLRTEETNAEQLYQKPHTGQSNVASNLVNYLFSEEEGKQFIYNVVYTGQKPQTENKDLSKSRVNRQSKFKDIQVQDNQEQQIQQQMQVNEEPLDTEENESNNIIKINVDLNELKKLYPTIDSKSTGLMKIIGEQLIDGIRYENSGANGKVLIDQSKLNPKCIEVEECNVNVESINRKIDEINKAQEDINQRSKMIQQNQTVQENKKILLKQTRFFSKQKYLILIYIIERKVKKIQNTAFDTVFEEYEVLYQINCINLSGKNQNPIIWEVTPEEVLVISEGIKDNMERARFLMRRVQVFNQKIIFTVLKKVHMNKVRSNPNLIVYYEQGLIPIQNHFRNRRFRRNFQNYKDEIKQKHANIIHKCIPEELRSLTQYYLLVCIDHKEAKDKWELVAWDMVTFERYSKEIKSTEFINYAAEFGRQVTVEFIAKFIDIDPSSSELSINSGITSYFKQYKEELKKKKAHKDMVEKKIQRENPYN